MLAFYMGYQGGNTLKGSTMAFSVLCLARLFHGFNCRGGSSIIGLGLFSNMFSIATFVIGFILLNNSYFPSFPLNIPSSTFRY